MVHRAAGLNSAPPMCVDQVAPWKGVDRILMACSALPAELPWTLTVCGDEVHVTAGYRGERARLEDLARSLGPDGRVTFTGMALDITPYPKTRTSSRTPLSETSLSFEWSRKRWLPESP